MPVLWPATRKLADAGFVDSLRAVHPDPVAYPAWTWAAISEAMQAGDGKPEGWRAKGDGRRDVADRIDFVLHKGTGVHAVEAHVLGPQVSVSGARDVVDEGIVSVGYGKAKSEWTTDHRAVVVKFVVGATGGGNATIA
ncbi:hypothetical protein BCR44DRAFT_1431782 [Catenaria anguillulae PL171]|uniref:Endonuclease/exonuclease/phosphatase n=1 Tax=Catenaria anguillulae PL171 TaxID=765915 RepID=A0A1Y2HUG9_9FUNG|nr:hypothetical protein BCR44DRAFT_1431782 [Catenaria anguillulae PL171]